MKKACLQLDLMIRLPFFNLDEIREIKVVLSCAWLRIQACSLWSVL